jgi:hypothetical protein
MRKFKFQLNKLQLETVNFDAVVPLRFYRVICLISIDISRITSSVLASFSCVESLIFYGCIFNSVEAFQTLLLSCAKLKYLELDEPKMHVAALEKIENNRKTIENPPSIECFRFVLPIYAFSTEIEEHKEPWELMKVFSSISTTFTSIDLQFGVYNFANYSKIEEMLTYFETHFAENWKKLLIYNECSGPTYRQVMAHLCNMKKLKLTSLELTTSYDDHDDIKMLERFLEGQSSVMDFRLHEESYEKHFSISSNSLLDLVPRDPHTFNKIIHTLTNLQCLEFIVVEHDTFTFQVPTSVKHLKFRGRYEPFDLRLLPSTGQLNNLKILEMHNAHLQADDLQEIFRNMCGLSSLTITSSDRHLMPELFCEKSANFQEEIFTIGSLSGLQHLKLDRFSISDQVLMEIQARDLVDFGWYNYSDEVFNLLCVSEIVITYWIIISDKKS